MIINELNRLFDLSASIGKDTAELQTRTSSKIIEMLQVTPGMILGDDVGMGKTYMAISAAVYFLVKNPEKCVTIITPSWLLNEKWHTDIRNFIEKNLNSSAVNLKETDIIKIEQYGQGSYINQILKASKKAKLLIIPINVFASMGSKYEKSFLLCCWFKHKRLKGNTREKILTELAGDPRYFGPEEFSKIGITYREIPESWYKDLDQMYDEHSSKEGYGCIGVGIKNLRYKILNHIMPNTSLLILDEAHKMKNAETVKRKSLEGAISHKFEKALFLTATPFQLNEGELKSTLDLFRTANISEGELRKFDLLSQNMFIKMQEYKWLMNTFENYIHGLHADEAAAFEEAIESNKTVDLSSDEKDTYEIYQDLIESKRQLEKAMKMLIIRNVKKKNEYRREIIGSLEKTEMPKTTGIPLTKESYLAFALLEKAIFQILKSGDRTFIASVKQSFTSSFEAAVNSSVYRNHEEIESINILHQMNLTNIIHPKLQTVADEVVKALNNGDKTLVFCDRLETIHELKKTIDDRINRSYLKNIDKLYPENGQRSFDNFWKRFYNKQDNSWLLLQESYIHSILVPILEACGKNRRLIPEAADISDEVMQLYKRYNTTVKSNYMYLKRIIEHLVFQKTLDKIKDWKKNLSGLDSIIETANVILDGQYITLGLNLELDQDEGHIIEENETELRTISNKIIKDIIQYKGIWFRYREKLNGIYPTERDELIASMISFLKRDKRFFIELRNIWERYPEKDDSYLINRTFVKGDLLDWDKAYERFIEKYCRETEATKEEMRIGLSSADIVATISGSTSNSGRMRFRAGFNTPFYPQILIATATMQEGIDLQVECRRVIHYDLDWNPAALEQRVGRIDRIGSLISILREAGKHDKDDKDFKLDIFYPFIKNTIDESIFKTVKEREKWFNLILGGFPQWEIEVDPDVTNIKPWVFQKVQIDLSIKSCL